jgi:hypothetical protein
LSGLKPVICFEKMDASLDIGAVFTPLRWGKFAAETYSVVDAWLDGKTVLDPTMGAGNLLSALVESALAKGRALSSLPMRNLFGVDLHTGYRQNALDFFREKYGADMRDNFFNADILTRNDLICDTLFGNPPWRTFADLPEEYKTAVKPFFYRYGLIDDPRKLLLGGSRIDIAALIIQKSITENLRAGGDAVFFLPLSLFLNNGAHDAFRRFGGSSSGTPPVYSLQSAYDLENTGAFRVSTRYGIAHFKKFKKIKKSAEPSALSPSDSPSALVPYFRFEKDAWIEYQAAPAFPDKKGSPFLVFSKTAQSNGVPAMPTMPKKIDAPYNAKPRQGVNPCGAADVFFFNECEDIDEHICRVGGTSFLPKKYVYPLITKVNFKEKEIQQPAKWVLMAYNEQTGKPLTPSEIAREPLLCDFLNARKSILENRKGTIIRSWIKGGVWWALLGAGAYSFAPYKIVWEAYGKKNFNPRIFTGRWQANQSLQAFIPCHCRETAERLLAELSKPEVEEYLLASRMAGTMNWAQPGKIAALLARTVPLTGAALSYAP